MDIKEILSRKFVEGHKVDGKFLMLSAMKLKEEIEEFEEAIIKKQGLERIISEMMDMFQATYSNLLALEIATPVTVDKVKEEWLVKQEQRIIKYSEKGLKKTVTVDGKEVELSEEQVNLISRIIKGGKK